MDVLKDIFFMPLFPHIYAIPLSIIVGVAVGYYLRGRLESTPELKPKKPEV